MIVGSYPIQKTKGRTTQDILFAAKLNESNHLITNKNFPLKDQVTSEVEVVILEFGKEMESGEVVGAAWKLNLARPTPEDVFLFAEQHPEVQLQAPIVFLHEPWYYTAGCWLTLVLDSLRSRRRLRLMTTGGRWHDGHRFAFIRKISTK